MLQKIYKVYCRTEEVIVGIFFVMIILLTFTNALLRYFGVPLTVVDDLNSLMFGWAAFLGADVAFRHSRLVGMNILTSHLPIKVQKALQLLVLLIMGGSMLMFANLGFKLAIGNWARSLGALPISYGVVTICFPVTCVLMILTAAIKIVNLVKNFGDDSYSLKNDILGADDSKDVIEKEV